MRKPKLLMMNILLACITCSSIVLTSCSNEDTHLENKKNGEIRFSTNVATVKAASVEAQIPNNQTVGIFIRENAASPVTTYDQNLFYTADVSGSLIGTTQHFPNNGNGVRISAYHPYSESNNDIYTFSVKQNQKANVDSYQSDLLFCPEFTQTSTTGDVTLQFKHILSLVTYNLTAGGGNPDLTGIQVSAVNVATSIEFNRRTGELTSVDNLSEVAFGKEGGIVVPQTVATGTKLLKISLSSGKELYYETPNELVLESGKKYTFNLKVNLAEEKAINMSTEVKDWEMGAEINGSVGGKLRTDIKLGAYFFGAWYDGSAHIQGPWADLAGRFPERESTLGWANCNSKENISAQIDMAKQGGLSFFCFDWYQQGTNDHKQHPTNRALQYFKEVNNGRMEYCILAVNDVFGGTYQYTPTVWNEAKKYWIEELRNPDPNYLRIDGKPLLVFYIGEELVTSLAGKGNYSGMKTYIDAFRAELKAVGGPEILIAACNFDIANAYNSGMDIITQYNLHVGAYALAGYTAPAYNNPIELDSRHLYQVDVNNSNKFADNWKKYPHLQKMQYIPVATTGWDTRSTTDQRQSSPYFVFSEEQVYNSVSGMINWIDQNNEQGYTTNEKIGFVYAWNEYNEGAWLLPQKNGGKPLNGLTRALTK